MIARLTDYQIVNCYLFPQTKRQEAIERRQKGLPPEAEESDEPSAPPSRDYMIMTLMRLGMSAEDAAREYDEQLRLHEAERQGQR